MRRKMQKRACSFEERQGKVRQEEEMWPCCSKDHVTSMFGIGILIGLCSTRMPFSRFLSGFAIIDTSMVHNMSSHHVWEDRRVVQG